MISRSAHEGPHDGNVDLDGTVAVQEKHGHALLSEGVRKVFALFGAVRPLRSQLVTLESENPNGPVVPGPSPGGSGRTSPSRCAAPGGRGDGGARSAFGGSLGLGLIREVVLAGDDLAGPICQARDVPPPATVPAFLRRRLCSERNP